ncbi:MAG: sensor histidine kinase [Povalibacter sp.]
MHKFKLPTGADKPSWSGWFGVVPVAYVFVDPWQKGASWIEWLVTALAFAIFLGLFALGSIYWSRQDIMRRVCVAIAGLALAFTFYRPSGVIFFVFVAAFAPLATGGHIVASAAIILSAAGLSILQSRLLWPPNFLPTVIAVQSLLIGAAITVVIRQQIGVRRALKETERERIARDLHDILGHTLSVIILKSELASRLFERDPQRAKVEIDDVQRISRNALSEVREAITGYRDGDLQSELNRAQSTLETAGLAVERICDPVDMAPAQERVLALVLREAVTNVVRHSQAKHCRLTLQRTEEAHQMTISDDGCGVAHREGMGMRGIRERVAALGGEVSWNMRMGTELVVTVPLDASIGENA